MRPRRVGVREDPASTGERQPGPGRPRTVAIIGATLVAALLLGLVGLAAFLYSGVYDIAARSPHTRLVRGVLTTLQERSVAFHARGIEAPPLDDPELVQRGLALYREQCLVCHGAPGESRGRVGVGLNPNPPPLVDVLETWTPEEIYWVITNGLKMAGMPAFGLGADTANLWALTAFVLRMQQLSPRDFGRMVAALEGRLDPASVPWVGDDGGAARLAAQGDAARGKRLVAALGCGSCHVVPGVPGANGTVGPPLTRWARRNYIAGTLANTPDNLVAFILEPDAIEPGTAMPDVGATEQQALDVAAYLFTLE